MVRMCEHSFSFVISLVFLVISLVDGINENPYKEKSCIQPPSSEELGLDLSWFGGVEKWTVPLWTNLYAIRTASDAYEKATSQIQNSELGHSCLQFKNDMTVRAYGRKINYTLSGDATSIGFVAAWPQAKSAKFEFHLTDNESFVLGITCWEDNQSGYAVISTKSELSAQVRNRVLEYVYKKGFRKYNSRFEDYSGCESGISGIQGQGQGQGQGHGQGGYATGGGGGYSNGLILNSYGTPPAPAPFRGYSSDGNENEYEFEIVPALTIYENFEEISRTNKRGKSGSGGYRGSSLGGYY